MDANGVLQSWMGEKDRLFKYTIRYPKYADYHNFPQLLFNPLNTKPISGGKKKKKKKWIATDITLETFIYSQMTELFFSCNDENK